MRNLLLSAASVGIIGGADGPTAIFVASSPDWWKYAVGAAVIALIIFLMIRRRKKS